MRILVKMAVQSFVIEDVHNSAFVRFRVSPISFNKGAGANQIIKHKKKEIQAQCKALICGRRKEKRLI